MNNLNLKITIQTKDCFYEPSKIMNFAVSSKS